MCNPTSLKTQAKDIVTPKAPLKFPAKLYRILNTPEFNDIICWMPHGHSWRVLQQERFEKEVLPVFFRHGRYASFVRQVNGWGFRRIQSGPDFNSYYHRSFLRESPESCRRMKRPSIEELADRKKADLNQPPNFYLLSTPSENKQESEKAVPSSSTNAPSTGFKSSLISRLLMCSSEEKDVLLNFELERLDERRQAIRKQLQTLQLLNRSNAKPVFPYAVPSLALQSPAEALMKLSMIGEMQFRTQLLPCGGGR